MEKAIKELCEKIVKLEYDNPDLSYKVESPKVKGKVQFYWYGVNSTARCKFQLKNNKRSIKGEVDFGKDTSIEECVKKVFSLLN